MARPTVKEVDDLRETIRELTTKNLFLQKEVEAELARAAGGYEAKCALEAEIEEAHKLLDMVSPAPRTRPGRYSPEPVKLFFRLAAALIPDRVRMEAFTEKIDD